MLAEQIDLMKEQLPKVREAAEGRDLAPRAESLLAAARKKYSL